MSAVLWGFALLSVSSQMNSCFSQIQRGALSELLGESIQCPGTGEFYKVECLNLTGCNSSTPKQGCALCKNAPQGAFYYPSEEEETSCSWECGYAYSEILQQCVFSPPEIIIKVSSDRQETATSVGCMGIYVQVYLSNIYAPSFQEHQHQEGLPGGSSAQFNEV